jgi:hypothetical protein
LLFANIKRRKHKTYSYEIQYQSNSRRQQHDPTTGAVMPLFSNVNICQTSPGNLLVIMATVVQQIHKNS